MECGGSTPLSFLSWSAAGRPGKTQEGDTCAPELYSLKRKRYKKATPSADGWLRSAETGLELRRGEGNRLAIRLEGNDATRQELSGE